MSQLRFCANLSILFTELPLLDRPAAAAAAGFDGVELWWPFPEAVPPDAALGDLERALGDAGVQLIGLNFDAGDLAAGDRGLVSLPGEGARFEDNVACVVSFAATQGTQVLNALYGNRVDSVTPESRRVWHSNVSRSRQRLPRRLGRASYWRHRTRWTARVTRSRELTKRWH